MLAVATHALGQNSALPCTFPQQLSPALPPDPTSCYGGIDKYLARSVFATGLAVLPLPDYAGLGTPKDYCDFIAACVALKAGYLSRVTYLWDGERRMIPGTAFYKASGKAVADIQSAYAAAGLRLPIIEAAILENVTEDVNKVPIPIAVLQAFKDEAGFAGNYTLTEGQYFKQDNICTDWRLPNTWIWVIAGCTWAIMALYRSATVRATFPTPTPLRCCGGYATMQHTCPTDLCC
ncbi:MAG: hypothetical protein EBZ77_04105 [Chitinophagia bacterium]|nr:hypothetical protein [Chitinophagia bacterium]